MAKGAGESAEKVVKDIRRKTRRRFSAEEKIRIVLEGLRGEATSDEVSALRKENVRLKELVAETLLENRVLKKSVTGYDSDEADT